MTLPQNLINTLQSAIGALELPPNHPLRREVETVFQTRSAFQIAVFGPFNYGKSTLLNALLGERTLPIDLIPTTGAAIRVRYGETCKTRIQFNNGQEIVEAGTEILKQFAILDDDRRMRDDVVSVEVTCPHPFLQTGVELLDLPGTNDREAQDELVRTQLLGADLVIQVLDGRKLMTLGEREHLRDWLLDCGITTVVFVVNFLNLLDSEDQKQVYNRLRFVAESFRADLPAGVSNLYRVDALPALRARLKGDMAAAQSAGLPIFETALQTITAQRPNPEAKLSRVNAVVEQVKQALQEKIDAIALQLADHTVLDQRFQIQQKAQALIQKGFAASVLEFQDWLMLDNLQATYLPNIVAALQSQSFKTWETGEFKRTAIDHQQAIVKWVHQACEFFETPRPNQLLITFPELPVSNATPPKTDTKGQSDDLPIAVATGLGWVFGGPVGAAVLGGASYLLDKALDQLSDDTEPKATIDYSDLAKEYLMHFSRLNSAAIDTYEKTAQIVLSANITPPQQTQTPLHHQLELLRSLLEQLTQNSGY